MKKIAILLFVISLAACNNDKKTASTENFTNQEDYNKYLKNSNRDSYNKAVETNEFWTSRLAADTSGVGDIGPSAGSYGGLFATTGNAQYLTDSETLYKKAISIASIKDGYVRGLAHNYISQHKFKQAKDILEEIYAGPTNKRATELILFDVYMELGMYDKAEEMLGNIKINGDFEYIIRQAKWNDHQGNLDAAIRNLEKAKEIAESSKNEDTRIWVYTNIADYYGHAGRLKDSYNHYLMALKLQPDNTYAKKQIAWLLYSKEKNTAEANRILDSVMVNHKVPDYYLIKSQMAKYEGNEAETKKQEQNFINAVTDGNYGEMYNTYLINLYADINPAKALKLAEHEVSRRATPETYQLLAYSQLQTGNKDAALKTIEQHVEGKTFEPKALYHAALIYKANGMEEKVEALKENLMAATYEIGPIMAKNVEML